MRDSKWRWIRHGQERLYDVGILADGTTLYNPNGYDPEIVREAIVQAQNRLHEMRSKAAKKAAATRAARRARQVYAIVRQLLAGEQLTPRTACRLCGKGLTDTESINRGIGSDCWQDVLHSIEVERAAGTGTGEAA